MKYMICFMKRHNAVFMLLSLFMVNGCGNSAMTPHPITTQNPLYYPVAANQQFSLAVVSQPELHLAGSIPVATVGNFPSSGWVGITQDGSVIVSKAGSWLSGRQLYDSSTVLCAPRQGSCHPFINGFGGEILQYHQGLAISLWHNGDWSNASIAFISGTPAKITRRVSLPPLRPGSMQLSSDGNTLFWATAGSNLNESRIIRYNLQTQQITASTTPGQQPIDDFILGSDGLLYVPVTFKGGSANNPGSTIDVYNTDLSLVKTIQVQQAPQHIAINSSDGSEQLIVSYLSGMNLDVIDVKSGNVIRTITNDRQIAYLSTLSNGEVSAIATDGGSSSFGNINSGTDYIIWHEFNGVAEGAAVG